MGIQLRGAIARTESLAGLERPAARRVVSAPVPDARDRWPIPRAAGWLTRLGTPKNLARLVWLAGIVSLLSAASPALHDRVRLVTAILPPVFPAAATTG